MIRKNLRAKYQQNHMQMGRIEKIEENMKRSINDTSFKINTKYQHCQVNPNTISFQIQKENQISQQNIKNNMQSNLGITTQNLKRKYIYNEQQLKYQYEGIGPQYENINIKTYTQNKKRKNPLNKLQIQNEIKKKSEPISTRKTYSVQNRLNRLNIPKQFQQNKRKIINPMEIKDFNTMGSHSINIQEKKRTNNFLIQQSQQNKLKKVYNYDISINIPRQETIKQQQEDRMTNRRKYQSTIKNNFKKQQCNMNNKQYDFITKNCEPFREQRKYITPQMQFNIQSIEDNSQISPTKVVKRGEEYHQIHQMPIYSIQLPKLKSLAKINLRSKKSFIQPQNCSKNQSHTKIFNKSPNPNQSGIFFTNKKKEEDLIQQYSLKSDEKNKNKVIKDQNNLQINTNQWKSKIYKDTAKISEVYERKECILKDVSTFEKLQKINLFNDRINERIKNIINSFENYKNFL